MRFSTLPFKLSRLWLPLNLHGTGLQHLANPRHNHASSKCLRTIMAWLLFPAPFSPWLCNRWNRVEPPQSSFQHLVEQSTRCVCNWHEIIAAWIASKLPSQAEETLTVQQWNFRNVLIWILTSLRKSRYDVLVKLGNNWKDLNYSVICS